MSKVEKLVKATMAQLLTISAIGAFVTSTDVLAQQKMEKCYGIVKAGKNDCQTTTASCAGSSTKDNQSDAFIFLPKGSCEKIVGSSLEPKKPEEKK